MNPTSDQLDSKDNMLIKITLPVAAIEMDIKWQELLQSPWINKIETELPVIQV